MVCTLQLSSERRSLIFVVMRKRVLKGLDSLFAKYMHLVGVVWLAWMVSDLLLGLLVFPRTKEGMWYIGLGGTLGCLLGGVVLAILKTLFHKKVVRALAEQGWSDA